MVAKRIHDQKSIYQRLKGHYLGFSPARLPRLGRGSWSQVQLAGQLAYQWQPRPPKLFLKRRWAKSLTKQFTPKCFCSGLKEFYESITWMEYSPRLRKRVRQLRPEVGDLLTFSLVILAVIVSVIAYIVNPNHTPHTPTAPHPAHVQEKGTGYEELLLPFYSEQEARACLKWLNETSQSRLWQALSRERIASARIEIIITKRPYKTWTEVYYLPKVGIRTIEQIITAWRKAK